MEKINQNNTRLIVKVIMSASLSGDNEIHKIKEDIVSAPGFIFKLPPLNLYKDNVEFSIHLEPVAIEKYKQSNQSKNMIELEERIEFEKPASITR